MKRIRALGLGVAMALALTAVTGAVSASASSFIAENEKPVTLEGTPLTSHLFVVGSQEFVCAAPPGFSMGVNGRTETVTTWTGSYSCTHKVYGKFTLEMNGCKYSLRAGAENGAAKFDATFEIGPAGCGPVKLNGTNCDVTFPPQSGIAGSSLDNQKNGAGTGDDSVRASGKATLSASTECGGANWTGLTYVGSWDLKAYQSGLQVGLRVQKPGLYMGKETFEAEWYPASLSGAQDAGNVHVLTLGSRKYFCAKAQFSGQVTGASSQMTIGAAYGGCETKPVLGISFESPISMNSCSWVLDAGGSIGVGCTKEGDAISIAVYGVDGKQLCTVTIPAQTGKKGVSYGTVGEGSARSIAATMNVKDLNYKIVGAVCGGKEKETGFTNGVLTGGTTLFGV